MKAKSKCILKFRYAIEAGPALWCVHAGEQRYTFTFDTVAALFSNVDGARTRVELGKARCRFHGGLSTGPTNRNTEPAESEIRPDLVWDNEALGLCVRCYGDGAKSFIFVYCIGDRQRFIRIGQTPVWSLEATRIRAKELRSIVEQGRDPARENRGREIPPVENIIQYIAEHMRTKP